MEVVDAVLLLDKPENFSPGWARALSLEER
jgi:hypothetical protein